MGRRTRRVAVTSFALTAALAACGSSKTAATPNSSGGAASTVTTIGGAPNPNAREQLPPGDIPDNQVFVPFTPATGSYTMSYPQGWAKREVGATTTFTQNFNSIAVTTTKAASAPTTGSARSSETAQLSSVPGFHLNTVDSVTRSSGPAIRIVYNATSATDAVTGKSVTLDVERYLFWHTGVLVTITLSSPKGSDNVDPWKTVTSSLAWK